MPSFLVLFATNDVEQNENTSSRKERNLAHPRPKKDYTTFAKFWHILHGVGLYTKLSFSPSI